jgi:hypothetical protein
VSRPAGQVRAGSWAGWRGNLPAPGPG